MKSVENLLKLTFEMDKLTLEERRRRRFSESFRKQVNYIEEDLTIGQVAHEFDVKTDSVRLWVKKYGNKNFPTNSWPNRRRCKIV